MNVLGGGAVMKKNGVWPNKHDGPWLHLAPVGPKEHGRVEWTEGNNGSKGKDNGPNLPFWANVSCYTPIQCSLSLKLKQEVKSDYEKNKKQIMNETKNWKK